MNRRETAKELMEKIDNLLITRMISDRYGFDDGLLRDEKTGQTIKVCIKDAKMELEYTIHSILENIPESEG